jgi:hypothetical protein
MPTAPASSCQRAMTGLLCVLVCGRRAYACFRGARLHRLNIGVDAGAINGDERCREREEIHGETLTGQKLEVRSQKCFSNLLLTSHF